MMVRLAVQTPDPPPLINNASTQVIASGNGTGGNTGSPNNNYSVHQATTDQINPATTATPPMTAGSVSPSTQQQQNSHQMAAQNIPPGAIPLNQLTPHHIPPYHHHPSGSNGGGVPHIHDHNNGHHHNGLYMPYPNEYYSPGSDGPPHYFLPPELCPAHTQICTVHPEYGKQIRQYQRNFLCKMMKIIMKNDEFVIFRNHKYRQRFTSRKSLKFTLLLCSKHKIAPTMHCKKKLEKNSR